jgi:hypothetical protein
MLKADSTNRDPPCLLAYFLGYYILINQSRLIQFFINGYSFLMSIAIIFFPKALFELTPFLIGMLLHQAILSSVYTMLVLKKLMFGQKARAEGGDMSSDSEGRADNEEDSLDDEAPVTTADNDMAASNSRSYIDDEENSTRSPSRAKGSLWLQSSSSDSSFILHSPSDSKFNISSSSSHIAENSEVSLTREVKKLSI